MKKPTNQRPEAEPLESLVLLSTFVSGPRSAVAVVYHPVAASSPVATTTTSTRASATVVVGHASPPAIPGYVAGVGHASPSSAVATTAARPTVIAGGSAPGRGGTVHAMVLPGGHAVAIGHGSTTAAFSATAARVPVLGHGLVGLKST